MAKLKDEIFQIIKKADVDNQIVNEVTLINILNKPEWDWRKYVDNSLKKIWSKLSLNERALIYYYAKRIAQIDYYITSDLL